MVGRELTDPADARTRCDALREAGRALADRPVREVVAALAGACARWSDPADPDRREAERALAEREGVPIGAIATVLDAAFPAWTEDALVGWLEGELGTPEALDRFVEAGDGRRRAFGPRLLVGLSARGVPTTPVADLLAALCVKAPAWIKPASGSDDLAVRFAASLALVDPELGRAVETAGWTSGAAVGDAVLAEADLVVATGGAGTMEAVRRAVGAETRLLLHGPRMAAAAVLREALEEDPEGAVAALADDVAFAGQAGCLSPVAAWVEASRPEVDDLADRVRAACEQRWPAAPRRRAPAGERAAWAEWTSLGAVEEAAGRVGLVVGGPDEAWTVQTRVRAAPPDPPPVPRALVLAPVEDAGLVAGLCARRRGLVAAVGIAGPAERRRALAPALAEAGVERIAPLGRLQRPPVGWRRDGRPTLGDLVRWADRE